MSFCATKSVAISGLLQLISMITTSSVLFLLWMLEFQQICYVEWNTKNKTLSVIGLGFFALLLNTLTYLSSIYQNFKIPVLQITLLQCKIVIEAITIIYGSIIYYKWFMKFLKHISPTDIPQIFQKLVIITPIFVGILTVIFYSFALFNLGHIGTCWIRYFYIIFSIVITIGAVAVYFYLKNILKLLNNMHYCAATKKTLRIALIIDIILIIQSFIAISLSINAISRFTDRWFSFDWELISNVSMSGFIITFTIGLTYWIFQRCVCQCCVRYIWCFKTSDNGPTLTSINPTLHNHGHTSIGQHSGHGLLDSEDQMRKVGIAKALKM